jgi:hypothetical protein
VRLRLALHRSSEAATIVLIDTSDPGVGSDNRSPAKSPSDSSRSNSRIIFIHGYKNNDSAPSTLAIASNRHPRHVQFAFTERSEKSDSQTCLS